MSPLVDDLQYCYKEAMAPPWEVCLFLLLPCWLTAMLIGNPAEPALSASGIFTSPDAWASIRVSFLEDYVYRQRFQDEYIVAGFESTNTFATLSTKAGMATVNFEERIDLYGILGASRLQLNQEIYSKMQFSWGFGGKIILYKTENFFIGTDIKYFDAPQEPIYFLAEGLPLDLAIPFKYKYNETQFAFGMCYRVPFIAPYLYATYLITKIEPNPTIALVRWPFNSRVLVDAECKSLVANRRWGMAVGATLVSNGRATLAVESRMFNQNAIDVNLDVRF